MPVDVVDESGASSLEVICEQAGMALLTALDLREAELVVVLCGDARIQELNAQWRGRDLPTDVLSFAQEEGEGLAGGDPVRVLGDIVISTDRANIQAQDGDWTLEEEVARLLLHGLLHLLGFDHENGGEQEARMKAEEARLSQILVDGGIGCAREDLS